MKKLDRIFFFLKRPTRVFVFILSRIPYFRFLWDTYDYQCRITLKMWFLHKILNFGGNRATYWPVDYTSKVVNPKNIFAGIDTCPGLMKGCYIQGIGGIYIDDYTQIAPNVGIISANHDITDTRKHIKKPVKIGKYCWIGFGAIILPGVEIGDFTIVAAGSVVTKSFPEGYCVLAGNPAKQIKTIDKNNCVPYEYKKKYYGYLSENKFKKRKHS